MCIYSRYFHLTYNFTSIHSHAKKLYLHMFHIVDTVFSYVRELIVCSYLQDFSNRKGSCLQLICNPHTTFSLCRVRHTLARGVSWGALRPLPPGSLKGHQKEKKKEGKEREKDKGKKENKMRKYRYINITRGVPFRCKVHPPPIFVVIGCVSLCGHRRQKECTKSYELTSKIKFFLHF